MKLLVFVGATIAGLLLKPVPAAAQGRAVAVALDATTGNAFGSGGELRDRHLDGGARVAASVRYVRPRQLGVFAELAGDALGQSGVHLLNCIPNSRGGCMASYPEFVGATVVVGIIVQPSNQFELRGGIGGGVYGDNGTNVGTVVTEADVALFLFPHFGLLAGTRALVVPRYRGDRLWMIPWIVGVRIR